MWTPVLEGALLERAIEARDAIARALGRRADGSRGVETSAGEVSLATGNAGIALFHAYIGEALGRVGDVDHREIAACLLDRSAAALRRVTLTPGLYTGFSGICWAIAHVESPEGRSSFDPFAPIDSALQRYVSRAPCSASYDLVDGFVGIGVYALERLPVRSGVALLESIVERLAECADRVPSGLTWFTRPRPASVRRGRGRPYGDYDLGVAHGVPGVIALLAASWRAGIARRRVETLLDGAVSWLLAQRLPQNAPSIFPYSVEPGRDVEAATPAWCYGDAGVAAVLLGTARLVDEPRWVREGLIIARRAARRPTEDARAPDAGLCHGAAGLGHVFNRLFALTDDPSLRSAARRWFAYALDLRRPRRGIAGFGRDLSRSPSRKRWGTDPGWLAGAAGIGLALLAATTTEEPEWDRLMLLSSPFITGRRPPSLRRRRSRQSAGALVRG